MTQSRRSQISLIDTPYYHCISRCVRRAFLCGEDKYSGQSYEHRRQWVVDRIRQLSDIFAIDVAAFAVMSNHYHLVLHIDEAEAKSWSLEEVVQHWRQIFHSSVMVDNYLAKQTDAFMSAQAVETIEKYRNRLSDISWFMRCLNEQIARKANLEDDCKGRFWEGRFKSQALLDNKAVISCMAYVDLNPIRAKIAKSLADSEYTSIYERINNKSSQEDTSNQTHKPLLNFLNHEDKNQSKGIKTSFLNYKELVEWTGRVIRDDKRGFIEKDSDKKAVNTLKQLGFSKTDWLILANTFGKQQQTAVGTLAELTRFAMHTHHKCLTNRTAEMKRMFH